MDSPSLASEQRPALASDSARPVSSVAGQSSHSARRSPPAAAVASLCAPIASELAAVERRLQRELQSPYESLVPLLRHGVQLGGKRLRPVLALLAGAVVNSERVGKHHETLAAVLEMVHTATLIHDDVLDGASERRHVATINSTWGDHASILLGDYLFSQAFRLSASTGSALACQWIGEAARRVCEGELRQVMARDQVDLDQAAYLEMIRGKTAELCSVACRLGATFAGGDDLQVAALADYGMALGIAFQIADDYLDVWGDPDSVGKTLGTDLEQGKWTLPVLRLKQTATGVTAQRLMAAMKAAPSARRRQVMPLLDASDAQAYTRQIAKEYRDASCQAIADVPESPAKRSLIELATFAIERTF